MFVLHTLYHPHNPDNLLITGENCTADTTVFSRDGSDSPDIPHPVATTPEELIRVLALRDAGIGHSETLQNMEFPVNGDSLVCSPEWEREVQIKQGTPQSLTFFTTPGLLCPLDLLLFLPDQTRSREIGFIAGGSCRFWIGVTALAREMVLRGRYLPTTGKYRNGGICTVWKPVPSSYDLLRIRKLGRAMPGTQQRYLKYGYLGENSSGKEEAVHLFIRMIINRIICLAGNADPVDYGVGLTPMERLRYAQELTAIYYLQGIERHNMPIATPQITNGWRESFHSWSDIHPGKIPDELPFTICCRLDEIGNEYTDRTHDQIPDKTWQISFLVRPADEPDLLLPVDLCMKEGKNGSDLISGMDGLEGVLSSISKTLLESSQFLTCPETGQFPPVIFIAEHDLIRFLTYDLPNVRKAGIEMILPGWWETPVQKAQLRLALKRRDDADAASLAGLQAVLNFDYRIAVGDDFIEPAAFHQMVKEKTSTIRAGKRWVTIDPEQIRTIIPGIGRSVKKNTLSVADFLRILFRPVSCNEDLVIQADDDWTSNLISCIRTGYDQKREEPPDSFKGILRPYQEKGLSFLLTCRHIGFGACLADDMGLGKTPQTIAYLLACKEKGLLSGPSLLVCPTSIIGNWERELIRFSPGLSVYIHHGSGRKRDRDFSDTVRGYDLIITSYALVPRDVNFLSRITWSALILDEVQNIKNSRTLQFQAIRNLSAIHRVALTGTPVENHLTELWAIMEILNPEYLGSLNSFQKIYAGPIEKQNDQEKAAELRRIILPFLLRRVKTDASVISDLPQKIEIKEYCTLTHEQAVLYQAALNELADDLQGLSGMTRRGRILAALTRLKQICNHPALVTKSSLGDPGRSGKVIRLMEMLEEVREEGECAIIFSQYATFSQILAAQIQAELGREVLVMTGSTPRQKREEMITRFMHHDGPRFFVISLKSGGTGLNLMRATHVFHIDRWWNPAIEDQATDRTFRIGQTRAVLVHLMITTGTVEEQIDAMIQKKRVIAGQVITAGEEWLTELPSGELMDILRLRTRVFGDDI